MSIFKTLWGAIAKKKPVVEQVILDEEAVMGVFDELKNIATKKERIQTYLTELESKLLESNQLQSLDQPIMSKLTHMAGRIREYEDKKQTLKGRLIQNNVALMRIAEREDEVPDLIKEMQQAEKRRRETENNIFYLQEEKMDLLNERESLITGYRFLKWFSLGFIILLLVILFSGFAMLQILREKIWLYMSGIAVVMVVFLMIMLYTKERMEKEIKVNEILQHKAARYLNKCKIRLFHQTRYLDFQYQKLGIDSAAKLEMHYNRYMKNKSNERVYKQLNVSINEIEEDIIDLLKKNGIEVKSIEYVLDWLLDPSKKGIAKHIKDEMQRTKEQEHALSQYEEELWKEVYALREDPDLKMQVEAEISRYKKGVTLDKVS